MIHTADDIGVYDDRLDLSLLVEILKDVKTVGFRFGWQSSKAEEFSHWNVKFAGSKKERYDCRHEMPDSVGAVWDALLASRVIDAEYRPVRAYVNSMPYGCEGWPHTDSHVESDLSIVIYLNPEWPTEWYGETAIFDDDGDILKSVMPKFGRVTVFPGVMLHAARSVSRICPEQRLVLVYKAACEP